MTPTKWPMRSVIELQDEGALLVEDGNHGEYRPRSDEFGQGEYAFIRAADMDGGRVLFESAQRINDKAVSRIRKGFGQGGDVLFSHKGTVGKLALVPLDAPPFVCSPQTTFWRTLDEERLDRRYLYCFMRSRPFTDQWMARSNETDMAAYVSLTAQRQLDLALPAIDDQRAIAGILGALDDKMEQNRRTLRALERLAKAVFRAWFVDFEPVKAKAAGATSFPSMPQQVFDALPTRFVDSDIGPVPEGWEVKALSSVCTLVSGGTPKRSEPAYWDGEVPWYSVKDAPSDGELWVIDTTERITDDGLANSAARMAPKGCTIISARGTVGKLAMAGTPMAFNQSCYGLLPGDGYSFGHLHLLMQTAVAELQQRTHGSVFDTITRATFEGLLVAKPESDVVSAFESVVAPTFELMLASLQESSKLAEVRDYLLPGLLSGQVQVEVAHG